MNDEMTLDSLVNLASHLGDARDKQSYSRFEQRELSKGELEEAYKSWLPHKVARIFPDDMTREGRDIKLDGEEVKPLIDKIEELQVLPRLGDGYTWGRLYGGGAVYMVIPGDDPQKALDLSRISLDNPITGLLAFDRYDVETVLNEDSKAPNFLRPESYRFTDTEVRIHWTRVLGPFDGYKLPNRMQKENQGWGGSEVERVSSALLQALSVNASVTSLVHRADALTMGVKGLLSKTANATKTAELVRRFEVLATLLSNNSFLVYDKDNEEPGNLQASLSAPSGVIAEMMSIASSAVGVPVSRFFGTAPKGLNATGEGDRKDYQASVVGKQKTVFDPALQRLDPVLLRSVYGKEVGMSYTWSPLEQMSDLENANTKNAEADAHSKYVTIGAVTRSMVSQELLNGEEYAALDEQFVKELGEAEGKIGDENGVGQEEASEGPPEGKESQGDTGGPED